ncbi:c2h2 finger domain containing protein [Grosmannia clavigera kw1407]|uniref:C2h2 finger domain containing protein n=1 Tax=Grosmannia clavigera (strain kw1407 / UAMH 11150) TaxID=655863 RepID=F0XL19_GROCL|nr:c2h2 finger domain containing protein [Grosmannia clavigera kw1407]EFX01796.1 c2h2 finger domain containing protein [Grosmannia clavigera kw1407]
MSTPQDPSPGTSGGYKRASRKGAPRRYACQYPGCDRVYSRQEHLQRHQLNHNPTEIFICDRQGCTQRFVRADLLARHKKRHSGSYTPRNRIQSFSDPQNTSLAPPPAAPLLPPREAKDSGPEGERRNGPESTSQTCTSTAPSISHPSASVPHDAAILLTPESSTNQPLPQSQTHIQPHSLSQASPTETDWTTGALMRDPRACDVRRPKAGTIYPPSPQQQITPHVADLQHHHVHSHGQEIQETAPGVMPFNAMQFMDSTLVRDYFTSWLFDNQASFSDFNIGQLPFLEGGLESPFNNSIHYDYESLTSHSHIDTPPRLPDIDEGISEIRRQEVLREFELFRVRRSRTESQMPDLDGATSTGGLSMPTLKVMNDCLNAYWEYVSPRVPIVHQPTFFCNTCPPLLLLVVLALGAAALHGRQGVAIASEDFAELGGFADSIIVSARWEILTDDEASPPVALWVAQALLLIEFYEKMYSTRRLHERSHIYHSATLTLLRRGSPLIGRSGSESPPDEALISSATNAPLSSANHDDHRQRSLDHQQQSSDWHAWWTHWAEKEAMHRVVFAAFCFDVTHAAMFGHAADMAPHEIRLPLPCDDNLWTAWKPDDVRKYDADLRMYGVKPSFFLDGLKRALHGQEVQTHSFGRMIIMCGLLSVGWHLNHREKHVTWLELKTSSSEAHEKWRAILLKAFDNWKESFDRAHGALGAMRPEPAVLSSVSATIRTRATRAGQNPTRTGPG